MALNSFRKRRSNVYLLLLLCFVVKGFIQGVQFSTLRLVKKMEL